MDDSGWLALEQERLTLADLLAGLSPDQWATASLCARWRVRDVAAHVAMTPTAPTMPTMLGALARARGDLWSAGASIAVAHAQRPTDEIVAQLRRDAAARSMPVFTTAENLLMDSLVHGQDIAIPLGIPRRMPPAAARAGFDRVWSMGWPFHARRRFAGLRLVATDADLSVGDGAIVEGELSALLLLVTGRTEAALLHLHGPGTTRIPA